jgi:hypothetical protein
MSFDFPVGVLNTVDQVFIDIHPSLAMPNEAVVGQEGDGSVSRCAKEPTNSCRLSLVTRRTRPMHHRAASDVDSADQIDNKHLPGKASEALK